MTRMDATRAAFLGVIRTPRRAVAWLVVTLFGRWKWQAPAKAPCPHVEDTAGVPARGSTQRCLWFECGRNLDGSSC